MNLMEEVQLGKAVKWFRANVEHPKFTICCWCEHFEPADGEEFCLEEGYCGLAVKESGCTKNDAEINPEDIMMCYRYKKAE